MRCSSARARIGCFFRLWEGSRLKKRDLGSDFEGVWVQIFEWFWVQMLGVLDFFALGSDSQGV